MAIRGPSEGQRRAIIGQRRAIGGQSQRHHRAMDIRGHLLAHPAGLVLQTILDLVELLLKFLHLALEILTHHSVRDHAHIHHDRDRCQERGTANAEDNVEVFLVDAEDLALLGVPDRPALGE